MKRILIVDVETTGVDAAKDRVIELGFVLWSVEHRCILEAYSSLISHHENPAEAVNVLLVMVSLSANQSLSPEPLVSAFQSNL